MLKPALLIACAASLLLSHEAWALDPAALVHAKHTLAAAVTHGKTEELQRARAEFATLLAGENTSTTLSYWVAVCDWRLVPMLTQAEPERAKKLCVEGIAACDRVLTAKPRDAGTLALKAGLQGLSLAFFPNLTMSIGPAMMVSYGTAAGIAPNDPRVAFLLALSTLHTPAQYGGGPDKAKPQFERAITLFVAEKAEKADKPDSTSADWGQDDALLWSGRCLSQLGDWAGAKSRFEEVLAINPEHAWTRRVLLPEAEKHLAAAPAQAPAEK
jgi:hypothetical protein